MTKNIWRAISKYLWNQESQAALRAEGDYVSTPPKNATTIFVRTKFLGHGQPLPFHLDE
jgi:hypothetical protein